jgi:multidrug efflux pump subunit AcrB
MANKKNLLQRPVTALCLLLGTGILAILLIGMSAGGESLQGSGAGYTVILRHYGVDAREMERTVAIPLEDALSVIPGVKNVLTSSENSQVRAFVRFDGKSAGVYEAVREAAQGVYETLPRSAQRPELISSGESRIPVWTAAVLSAASETQAPGDGELGTLLERVVKPALESLEGVGEAEISGTGLPEIVIALKPEETARLGLNAARIAAILARNDLLLPGGFFRDAGREYLITLDGRYDDSRSLEDALIPLEQGGAAKLKDLARIYERNRQPETLSRLDGRNTAVVSVMPGTGADLGRLSRLLKKKLGEFSGLPLEFKILSDRGAEEAAAYGSVLIAALQASAAVALMAAFLSSGTHRDFGGKKGKARGIPIPFVCALAVPFICVVSAALLSALGFALDRPLLAGLSAGVGAAVDAVILSSEGLGRARTFEEGGKALDKLKAPLVSGSVTTIAALLPLGAMKSLTGDFNAVAWAAGTVTLVSLVAALTVLPPLFLWGAGERPGKVPGERNGLSLGLPPFVNALGRRALRQVFRLLAWDVRLCSRRPWALLILFPLLSAAGVGALVFAGADTGTSAPEDSVYTQVEFEGGLRAEEADRLLAAYAIDLKARSPLESVQTSARTASGSVLVSFDPKIINAADVRTLLRSVTIPGAFVYIPETSSGEKIWQITLSGDDDIKCRELAKKAAGLCASLPFIRETVLNFKDGSKRLTLIPDRESLKISGLSFSAAADTVRRNIHGPVAYKRIGPQGETDVRIRGAGPDLPAKEDIGFFFINPLRRVSAYSGPLRLDSVLGEREGREPSSIRREDRRRTASISLRTKSMDPRTVRDQVMELLRTLELPPGYGLEFDREAIERAEDLSKTAVFFLLALLFCAMVIAGANESFGLPLAVLSVVPPSLALPALYIVLRGYPLNAAAACAFVAVSGMAVNASVLTADEIRRLPELRKTGALGFYRILRRRLPVLFATGGTTIAGALPFLFLREGANAVVRVLSLVTVLGVASSCLCSLTLIPVLAKISSNLFLSFEASSMPDPYRS